MADTELVTLVSQDGKEFKVELKAANMSQTVKNLIEDAGIENPVPLPNVVGDTLERIVTFMNQHKDDVPVKPSDDDKDKDKKGYSQWDLDFCGKLEQSKLFDLILASNYLDIPSLLDLSCSTVANSIKGKTPQQIRETFNIKNDFTPEEEEQIRKENEWCEER